MRLADGTQFRLLGSSAPACEILDALAGAMQLRCGENGGPGDAAVWFDDWGWPIADEANGVKSILSIAKHVFAEGDSDRPSERGADMIALAMSNASKGLAQLLERRKMLLLHAALAAHRGHGVLFAAPGGGGKSTISRRLPRDWRSLSDDATLVVDVGAGVYRAHPWPTWSRFYSDGPGGTWPVEESVRIDAIVFLTQSNDVYVSPLGHGHAAVAIAQSAEQLTGPQRSHHTCDNLTRDNRVRRFEMACDLALALPVLDLRLNMTDDFWGPLQEALNSPGSQGSSPK